MDLIEGKVTILPATTKVPLTLMGEAAGIAYHSNIEDKIKCRKRGLQCVKDGHGRMLEFVDVYMRIEGFSCRVIREFFRHVGDGLTAVQESTRYVTMDNFDYYVPPTVKKNKTLLIQYMACMNYIQETYDLLIKNGTSKEDAANVLPLGLSTRLAIKKNARNLSDMARVRLCNRAYVEFRDLMQKIVKGLSEYSDEWAELCPYIFKAKCEYVGWCDESHGCGKYPKKQDIKTIDYSQEILKR